MKETGKQLSPQVEIVKILEIIGISASNNFESLPGLAMHHEISTELGT